MNWEVITNVVWAALLTSIVVLELAARRSRRFVLTLGELVRSSATRTVPRAVILVGWMWVGWHAFAR
jgi:hypothetical protein